MKLILTTLVICFFNLVTASEDQVSLNEKYTDDKEYYKKGIKFYENGEFKKSFIVFFNLSEKGDKDSIYNLSNMFYEGIGTVQEFGLALKYSWLCSLNGNKRCLKKIKSIEQKLDQDEFLDISRNIPKILEDDFVNENNPISAFKLGYWYEKISPEIDFEKSYLWYSVSVSSGIYKAMKMRDRVGEKIEKKNITGIQQEANAIFTKNKYFNTDKDQE